jgi:hypothetical protein
VEKVAETTQVEKGKKPQKEKKQPAKQEPKAEPVQQTAE